MVQTWEIVQVLNRIFATTKFKEMAESEKIKIKPYSKQELADLYKIGVRSMTTWLQPFEKAIGKRHGRFYNMKQVRYIFEKLGLPGD